MLTLLATILTCRPAQRLSLYHFRAAARRRRRCSSCSSMVLASSPRCASSKARASRSARTAGLASPQQEGHADNGRADDPLGAHPSTLLWANFKNAYVWIVLFVTICFGAIGFYDDYSSDEAIA